MSWQNYFRLTDAQRRRIQKKCLHERMGLVAVFFNWPHLFKIREPRTVRLWGGKRVPRQINDGWSDVNYSDSVATRCDCSGMAGVRDLYIGVGPRHYVECRGCKAVWEWGYP